MKQKLAMLWTLFWTFAKMGVMTFGGGMAMLPILQREVVGNKHWRRSWWITLPSDSVRRASSR